MFRKLIALMLVGLLLGTAPALAKTKAEKEAQQAEKIKAAILKLGVGQDAQVQLKLRDKTKLAGYIQTADENFFVVVEAKTGVTTSVSYPNVTQVKGHNLSTGAKVAIVLGIVAGVLALLLFFENYG